MTSPSCDLGAADGELLAVDLDGVGADDGGDAPARATTAAWLTSPPRAVRMPSATCMPWTSSGEVSLRTRMTFSPRSAASAASSAVKYTRPTAAPGDGLLGLGILLVIGGRLGLGLGGLAGHRGGGLVGLLFVQGHDLAAALLLGRRVLVAQGQVEVGALQVGVRSRAAASRAGLVVEGRHLEVGLEDVLLSAAAGVLLQRGQAAAVVEGQLELALGVVPRALGL